MHLKRFGPILLAAALSALPAAATRAQPGPAASEHRVTCARECLSGFAERFLYAITNGDATAVPLAPDVRYTENGAELAIGDALWATADELGENRLIFTDPVSGGIQLYAAVVESGLPSFLAARLRVENRQITEIETSVLRREADDPATGTFALDRPIWTQNVPESQRVSRQALIDIADSYFEGITQGRGDVTPFHDDCVRFENGNQMTLSTAEDANPVMRMSCQEQFAAGMLVIVTSISHRRYLVIDEEAQVASAIVTFDHRGDLGSVPMPRGREVTPSAPFNRPFSFLIFESFKIIDGRIRQIEATVHRVPYRMHPGWPEAGSG